VKTFVQATALGEEIAKAMKQRSLSQVMLSKKLKITQGQISNVTRGRFKTENNLVLKICKYVKINPEKYRINSSDDFSDLPPEVTAALSRICSRNTNRRGAVVRILSLLEDLT
jgi:transcriptional regulator with XRE-family HTH domain